MSQRPATPQARQRPQQPHLVIVHRVRCPWCGSTHNYVYKTEGRVQRRICNGCARRFTAIKEPDDSRARGAVDAAGSQAASRRVCA